jgi:hypothetical protein
MSPGQVLWFYRDALAGKAAGIIGTPQLSSKARNCRRRNVLRIDAGAAGGREKWERTSIIDEWKNSRACMGTVLQRLFAHAYQSSQSPVETT